MVIRLAQRHTVALGEVVFWIVLIVWALIHGNERK